MAKNVYSLQLLRNGTPFTSYTEAVNAITGGTEQDGVLKLARYTSNESDSATTKYNTSTVKTIFGIRHDISGSGTGWTIFDSYHEVIQNIQDQIDSMTGGAGSIAQQIQAALDQLDFSGVTGNVVTGVEQTNGKVTATGANVGTLALTGYEEGTASGHVEASDSINAAIAKLQKQIDAANDAKDAAIADLDVEDTAVSGQYVSQVTETDGKIAVTRVELPSLAEVHEAGKPIIAVSEDKGQLAASAGTINAEFVNVTGETFSSTTVQGALEEIESEYKAADAALKEEILGDASESGNTLGKLEDRIEALDADAKEYVLSSVTPSSTNVKEAYALFDADGHQSGATINIYKDSAYKEIYLGTSADTIDATSGAITKQDGDKQSLNYAYMKADGTYDLVKVDVSAFLSENEFQSGVTAVDHIVRGVVDPNSEKDADNNPFLTVGENGFKVDGIKHAIDAAVSGASEDLQEAIDELSGKTEVLSAKTVTSIASADSSVTVNPGQAADGTVSYDLSTDASKVKVSSAYAPKAAAPIAADDTIDVALAKLEAQVNAAETTVEKDNAASHITLSSTTGVYGGTVYTIGENDIASKTDLDAEIAARKAVDGQSGQTYAANTSANYISDATSLNDADVKLDAALKTVADSANSAQTEIDAIETAVGLNADGTHKTSTGNYTNAATTIEEEILALDTQVKTNADNIAALSGKTITGITMNGSGVTVTNNVAAMTATYTNTAANSEDGMVITTGANGGLEFQFGTLDAGTY